MLVSDIAQNTQSFFLKFFSVPAGDCAAPQEMIDNGFYPYLQFLKALLFAQLYKLFFDILTHMPNIKVIVYFVLLRL